MWAKQEPREQDQLQKKWCDVQSVLLVLPRGWKTIILGMCLLLWRVGKEHALPVERACFQVQQQKWEDAVGVGILQTPDQLAWRKRCWKDFLWLFWGSDPKIIQETFHKVGGGRNLDIKSQRRTLKLEEWMAPGEDRENNHQGHPGRSRSATRRRWRRRRSWPIPGRRKKNPGTVMNFFKKHFKLIFRFSFWSRTCQSPEPTMFYQ